VSFKAARWAWSRQGLPPSAKLVLLALADCCNAKGDGKTCWPSLARLVEMTGASKGGLCKILDQLDRAGLIARERSQGGHSTTYTLNLELSPQETVGLSTTETVGAAELSTEATVTVTQGDSHCPLGRQRLSTEATRTYKEPGNEPR
jgi:hypothetical protein